MTNTVTRTTGPVWDRSTEVPVELPDPDERPLYERHPPHEAERLERARALWLKKLEEDRTLRALAAVEGSKGLERRVAELTKEAAELKVENAMAAEVKLILAGHAVMEGEINALREAVLNHATRIAKLEERKPWWRRLWRRA